ncbi:Hypothetical Protein NG00_00177 [Corynebacterium camporealensis]|uniref:Uncharacterized protein n=1 Tax=Corynebacterium camporealensis TaxID=161896 RepID=A0A0F6QV69_9CORY|nr:hypothetical protein [Corynebacterium camporealensis]AKE38190.1 hypothetical protein UL81_01020 [Corynebacterium camporealensis]AVH87507.1 Hypothetical Protein NG00_00177 [Corynebacterium camporealensis]
MNLIRDDSGSVTVEAALALSSLVILAAGIIGAIATLAAHLSAVDTAGAAARSHAIGIEYQPPREGTTVTVSDNGGLVTAEATVPAVFGEMSAHAVFPAEVAGRE